MKHIVTTQVIDILANGGIAEKVGYLCIQGQGTRICQGCTTACDQALVQVFEEER